MNKKVLVIVGQDLKSNNSANLCHLAYIKGFLENNCDIDILSSTDFNGLGTNDLIIDDKIKYHYYADCRFYHKLYRNIKEKRLSKNQLNNGFTSNQINSSINNVSLLRKVINKFRNVYGTNYTWYKNAKKFKSEVHYDLVISLSWPTISHKLAYKLIKTKHIKCDKWISLWEDPWSTDLYTIKSKKIFKEEKKLISKCKNIVYVTPRTLIRQQTIFKEYSEYMKWLPLPTYYERRYDETNNEKLIYGYYGDYFSQVRNIVPFYEAIKGKENKTYICGNSDLNLKTCENIEIIGRLPVNELYNYENKTDVLVFVSNLRGGQIPGKIYQYSSTNKVILFILDGDEEDLKCLIEYFSQFNRYVFCDNNIESINQAIKDINNNNISVENKTIEYFSPKSITKKLLEW